MDTCSGPLIWFHVEPDEAKRWETAALLKCASCDYYVATGSLNDDAHADAPLLVGA